MMKLWIDQKGNVRSRCSGSMEQQDTDAAKQWLQEAADAGHREAAWELSRLLTPTESKKAFSYLVKAADAGTTTEAAVPAEGKAPAKRVRKAGTTDAAAS